MKRDSHKNEDHLKDIQQDIQFLLSNIRARENGLIFFLERFTNQCKFAEEFSVFKEEFMQKEKIYASQVSRIVTKYTFERPQHILQQVRTFWIKVKSIVKVSLERLKILSLLNQKIFAKYEEIISLINKNYDEQKGLEQFSSVQNLLKKRNIQALCFCKNHFSSKNSDGKLSKNRSQSAFKHSTTKMSPKKTPYLQNAIRLQFDSPNKDENDLRMKSLNQYKKKKLGGQNKNVKNNEKISKKIHKNIQKYQRCFQGAMKGNIECSIDKKKTMKENQEALYDELFKKNIPNHKMISKFIFGSCAITSLLIKKPKAKPKKVIVKIERQGRESKQLVKMNKSKANREVRERPQSSQNIHGRGSEEEKKKVMIQTLIGDRKGKYRKKTVGRIQKYHKLIKLIS